MAIEVEDGTGKDDANSYCSVEFADAYFDERANIDWLSVPDKEAALVLGTSYIDGRYGAQWPGKRLNGRDQALGWPRAAARDAEGNSIPSDEVPVEVMRATCEAALREGAEAGSLTPDFVASDQIKRERKKVGDLEKEIEYRDDPGPEAARPVVAVIEQLLSGLLGAGQATGGMVYMDRA